MSCQREPCKDTKTCPAKFKDKKCKCVTNVSGNKKKCGSLQITCAHEEDGYLYACPVGCCRNQCDGGCPSNSFSIQNYLSNVSTQQMSQVTKFAVLLIIVFSVLILLSTLSLF
jgi:hypothetical protein